MSDLPPRSPALGQVSMLVDFDLDCGELIEGYRFVARGIGASGPHEYDGVQWPCVSLEYEIVPGLTESEHRRFFDFLVGVGYEVDGPLPWDPVDDGAIAPFEGGASTHGSRGDWPLPAGTEQVRFRLWRPNRGRRDVPSEAAGVIEVDLVAKTSVWVPNGD